MFTLSLTIWLNVVSSVPRMGHQLCAKQKVVRNLGVHFMNVDKVIHDT